MKIAFDLIFSTIGLVILSPLFLAIAWSIHRDDGGPVFYRGERVGKGGVPFRIFKFRTMVVNAEKIGGSSIADEDPRITRIGALLRKYKLDELPQLFNVLVGDMSLVGPRPQVRWAVARYSPEERRLLTLRPGITDYASLRFPNEGEILKGSVDPDRDYLEKIHPEKMRLSLHYLYNRSFREDLKILVRTLKTIVTLRG
jgi:lipopolysaccharide/colanic/teichoic acid biosynthesis glycosyltransferase